MIIKVNNNKTIESVCNNCKASYTTDFSDKTFVKFNEEFNQYNNLILECNTCDTVEIININLPLDELSDEFFEEFDLPDEEKNQRKCIRKLITMLEFEVVK